MTIAATLVASINSNTDAGSYNSGVYTPGGSGRLVLIGLMHRGVATSSGASGASITSPTKVVTVGYGSNAFTEIISCLSTGSAGAINIAFPDTNTMCIAHICELTGVDTSSAKGVVQSAASTSSVAVQAVTLAAFGTTANATFAAFGGVQAKTYTPETGYVELGDDLQSTPEAGSLNTIFLNHSDTSPSTQSTSGGQFGGGVAVEIQVAAVSTLKANPLHIHSQAVHRASRW